jgi:hypothetical protein
VEASAPALLADQFQSMGGSLQSLGSVSTRAVVNRQLPARLLDKLDPPVHRGPQELSAMLAAYRENPHFSRTEDSSERRDGRGRWAFWRT